MSKDLVLVTGNENKFREIKALLDFDISRKDLDIEEIQSIFTKEVSENKAIKAYQSVKKPVIVEDIGFCVEAWNSYPGALIKWIEKYVGLDKFVSQIMQEKNWRVFVEITIAYFDGSEFESITERIEGRVVRPRGENGFGFDSIFVPKGYDKTQAEMSFDEKNSISIRKIAYEKLNQYLKQK